ncbi:DNA-binding transcriptional LysR family regulator [Rhodococcus sp. BE178]
MRRTLYAESMELVTRLGHPLAGRSTLQLNDLPQYPWILPGVETALRRELEELFARNTLSARRTLSPSASELVDFLEKFAAEVTPARS